MANRIVRAGLLVLVVAIAALMAAPAASSLSSAAPPAFTVSAPSAAVAPVPVAPSNAAPAHTPTGAAASAESRALTDLRDSHVPMNRVFLPNYDAQVTSQGNVISPLYTGSPAPMGLGDFGVQEVHGANVGTISYTQSIEGQATLNSIDPLYVTSSAPDEFTIQLNTVLTNVDVLGNVSNDYWIQNVPFYSVSSQTLSFENNIWNFSSPAIYMGYNAIYSGRGSIVGNGEVYIAAGPSYHIPMPFTVNVYNNATVVNDRPTVYFNYSVTYSGGTISGSYDQVEFNSSATPPTSPAPMPTFQINGQQVDPTGFLLNDAEIMLGGPGGGSTTTIFNIDGSMGLWLLPNGTATYQAVPAAYDFGTDTGETSEGIAEYAPYSQSGIAVLGTGPSILYPLWGIVGAHRGAETITVNLAPTNAFVFANVGKRFSVSAAAWAPTEVSGPTTYVLSPNEYSFRFLLSEYTPVTVRVAQGHSATISVSLASNPSLGDYTPLWAESNSQLAAISSGGNGTVGNPYDLFNAAGTVSGLFGELNDYLFPVFPGIYLIDTSAYVSAYDMPLFELTYILAQANNNRITLFGAPSSNDLNFELYNASHVSIVDTPAISGWFYNAASFADPAAIYLWNSTDDLIAGNTIYVESNGITTANGGNNVIWGNVFYPTTVPAPNPGAVLNAGFTYGLNEFEGGDLIYNNEFLTPVTATLFPVNFYNGVFEPWVDTWNVSRQPATDVLTVNGWNLSGNILGLNYEGGNYWWNYGTAADPYGVLPYDNGGYIWYGGDYVPLVPFALYHVTFHESGLPAGTSWWVTLNGYTQTTNGTSIVFFEPNGTYAYTVGASGGYTPHHSSGAVVVNGAWRSIHIHFH
jgi:thermopsin